MAKPATVPVGGTAICYYGPAGEGPYPALITRCISGANDDKGKFIYDGELCEVVVFPLSLEGQNNTGQVTTTRAVYEVTQYGRRMKSNSWHFYGDPVVDSSRKD